MAKRALASKLVTLAGAATIASLLFWMALYLIGPAILIVNVVVLLAGIPWFTRHFSDGWTLAERAIIACIVSAQAGLVVATLVRIAPVVAKHAL